uniref:DUF4939 domain-containing protein n=1 Tax=Cyprinus carpio TaxID=7962 RepID=A0A8C1RVS8_CYPCA
MEPRPLTAADMLEELVNTLRTTLMPTTALALASACPMAIAASFAGDTAGCGGFLLQVSLFLEMQPQKFTTKRSKVAFLISLLSGKALCHVEVPSPSSIWQIGSLLVPKKTLVSHRSGLCL